MRRDASSVTFRRGQATLKRCPRHAKTRRREGARKMRALTALDAVVAV
jgi:hypothetical protein